MNTHKITRTIMALLIILQLLPSCVLADANSQIFENDGRSIVYISGTASGISKDKYSDKTANLIAYGEDGSIKAIEQTEIDSFGVYEFKFVLMTEADKCTYMIRAGKDNVTSTVNSVRAENNKAEYKLSIKNIDGEDVLYVEEGMSVELSIKNKLSFDEQRFKLIVAQYGASGSLIDVAILPGFVSGTDINNDFIFDNLTVNGDTVSVKAFALNNLSELTPLGDACLKNVHEKDEYKIYVSPSGSDTNAGNYQMPFKTINKAMDYACGLINYGKPVCVILDDGIYSMDDVSSISSSAAKFRDVSLTIKAKHGGEVIFSNGIDVDSSLIKPIKDESVLSRIPAEIADKCVQIDISSLNTDNKIFTIGNEYSLKNDYVFAPVYLNGRCQKMSVWPNSGYIDADGSVEPGASVVQIGWDINRIDEIKDGGGSIEYSQTELNSWENSGSSFVTGYLSNDYWGEVIPIKSIDKTTQKINLERYSTYGLSANARWRIANAPEAIDLPGEYYIDPIKKIIYLYPDKTLTSADKITLMGSDKTIINIDNAENITFEGITFDKTYGTALRLSNSSNVKITNCVFENIGDCAVEINSCDTTTVNNCKFINNENVPVRIKKCGDVVIIKDAEINITGNVFYNSGLQNYNRLIDIDENNCGVSISENTISGTDSGVIFNQGTNVRIDHNEIYNAARNSFDCGVIETGRMFTIYDNTIENNYIHDFGGNDTSNGRAAVNGVFLDDMVSGQIVRYNIIVPNNKNKTAGIKIGGGSDNTVQYNTVVNSCNGLIVERRLSGNEDDSIFSNQIWTRIRSDVDYSVAPWISQHPGVSKIISRITDEKTYRAKDNKVTDNVSYNCGGDKIDENPKNYGVINEFTDITDYTESIFCSADNQDFRLKSEFVKRYSLPEVLSDLNDINSIGSSTEIDTETSFDINYPYNNSSNIDKDNCWLSWQGADFADVYEVVIATDSALNNTIMRETTADNCIKIEGLESGKTYYWTVCAKNMSRKNASTWVCTNGTYCFTLK